MVRKTANGQLEQAMAVLINNQSSFLAHIAHFNEQMAQTNAQIAQTNAEIAQSNARIDERFLHIESELAEIRSILLRHEHMLQALPEAIREKIGFTPPNS